jgi:hypothetical protein
LNLNQFKLERITAMMGATEAKFKGPIGPTSLLNSIRPGDRVKILIYAGLGRDGMEFTPKTGRAVMKGTHGWILNMGGRYGTPAIADASNILEVTHAR